MDSCTFAVVLEVLAVVLEVLAFVIDVVRLAELLAVVSSRGIFPDGWFPRARENVSETFSSCETVGREL